MFWRFFAFAQNDSVVNKSVLFVLFRGYISLRNLFTPLEMYLLFF